MAIPAALRPISFDDADGDDGDDLPDLLPLRHVALQPSLDAADTAGQTEPAADPLTATEEHTTAESFADSLDGFDGAVETLPTGIGSGEASAAGDEDDQEDGYSSLLELSLKPQPRQQFIRIEEPEPLDAAIEPVVIFPGQAAGSHAAFAAPAGAYAETRRFDEPAGSPEPADAAPPPAGPRPFAAASGEMAPLRRFDSPASAAVPGQAVSAAATVQLDPEETQRALRSALASLQRMSGAA